MTAPIHPGWTSSGQQRRRDPMGPSADTNRRATAAIVAAILPPSTVSVDATDLRVALKYALAATQLDRSTAEEADALCRLGLAIGMPRELLAVTEERSHVS